MLGYINEREARQKGFTHHARYWMMPCWWNENNYSLETKFSFILPWIDIGTFLDNVINSFSHDEPAFRIEVGKEISKD